MQEADKIRAVADLGWEEAPCHVVDTLDGALAALQAERDENTCREPLAPSEMVTLGKQIEALERPKAADRERSGKGERGGGGRGNKKPSGKLPEGLSGDTRDKVGAALGVSGKTYEKAKQVADAAEKEPAKYGDLPAKMDAESVDAAHKGRSGVPEAHPTLRLLAFVTKLFRRNLKRIR